MAFTKSQIRARRLITQKGKTKPDKTIPQRKEPTKEELRYRQALLNLVNEVIKEINKVMLPIARDSAKSAKQQEKDIRDARFDTIASDLDKAFNEASKTINTRFNQKKMLGFIVPAITNTSITNKAAVNAQLKSVLGVDLIGNVPFTRELERLAIRENLKLVRSLRSNTLIEANQTISRGIRAGLTSKSIAANLTSQLNISKNRAKLIARDQISKLDGQLTRVRQQSAGIERYTWTTVGDERVRPTHQDLDNKIFSWSDPPPEGHPGEPINCRCQAEPIIDDII